MKNKKITVRELIMAALFAALIAAGAFIRIPIGIVPITFQTLFVAMAAMLLGPKLASAAMLCYIAVGLAGVPVFTHGGGIGYVLQPTFGYLLGFALAVFVGGHVFSRFKNKGAWAYALSSLVMLLCVHILGMAYLVVLFVCYLEKSVAAGTLFVSYFLVFLPNDLLSYTLASLLARSLQPVLTKISSLEESQR